MPAASGCPRRANAQGTAARKAPGDKVGERAPQPLRVSRASSERRLRGTPREHGAFALCLLCVIARGPGPRKNHCKSACGARPAIAAASARLFCCRSGASGCLLSLLFRSLCFLFFLSFYFHFFLFFNGPLSIWEGAGHSGSVAMADVLLLNAR